MKRNHMKTRKNCCSFPSYFSATNFTFWGKQNRVYFP